MYDEQVSRERKQQSKGCVGLSLTRLRNSGEPVSQGTGSMSANDGNKLAELARTFGLF